MNEEMKMKILNRIERLPEHKMQDIVNIVRDSIPDGYRDGDQVEIKLDTLDASTLNKLQKYLKIDDNDTSKRSATEDNTNPDSVKRPKGGEVVELVSKSTSTDIYILVKTDVIGVYSSREKAEKMKCKLKKGMDSNDDENYTHGECWVTNYQIFKKKDDDNIDDDSDDDDEY
jgi:hypothetical protein